MTAARRLDLQRALEALGPSGSEPRRLARMIFVEERSTADVARILGIPAGTVKSRTHKVRRLLRSILRRGGY